MHYIFVYSNDIDELVGMHHRQIAVRAQLHADHYNYIKTIRNFFARIQCTVLINNAQIYMRLSEYCDKIARRAGCNYKNETIK